MITEKPARDYKWIKCTLQKQKPYQNEKNRKEPFRDFAKISKLLILLNLIIKYFNL